MKNITLVIISCLLIFGCAKKPSTTGGVVQNSRGIYYTYDPGWIVNRNLDVIRLDHPDRPIFILIGISEVKTTTDVMLRFVEDTIAQSDKNVSIAVYGRDFVDVQGRKVCLTSASYLFGLTPFDSRAYYYGGQEGSAYVVVFVNSDKEKMNKEEALTYLSGLRFKDAVE